MTYEHIEPRGQAALVSGRTKLRSVNSTFKRDAWQCCQRVFELPMKIFVDVVFFCPMQMHSSVAAQFLIDVMLCGLINRSCGHVHH